MVARPRYQRRWLGRLDHLQEAMLDLLERAHRSRIVLPQSTLQRSDSERLAPGSGGSGQLREHRPIVARRPEPGRRDRSPEPQPPSAHRR
jgi:hypothetical protein